MSDAERQRRYRERRRLGLRVVRVEVSDKAIAELIAAGVITGIVDEDSDRLGEALARLFGRIARVARHADRRGGEVTTSE